MPHTPPKVKSKNVAGPPVYYPPGAAEFTKKEESSAAMSQAGVSMKCTLCIFKNNIFSLLRYKVHSVMINEKFWFQFFVTLRV